MNKLKIAVWNANGISQRKNEIQAFLIYHKVDIMLISETHLTTKNFFYIKNYWFYDTKHPENKARGGTGVLIRRGIKHYLHSNVSEKYLQATNITVEEWYGKCVFSAIYCPPRYVIDEEHFTAFFTTLGTKFLAGGDYNAKHTQWGSRLITNKGRQLWSAISNNNLNYISTGNPTYWPTDRKKIPDLIDFCVTKSINQNCIIAEDCHDLSSDHSPIFITMNSNTSKTETTHRLTSNRTNWNQYKTLFNAKCDINLPLRNEQDIDAAIDLLVKSMTDAALLSTPIIQEKVVESTLSTNIRDLISQKRALRKELQRTRAPNDRAKFNRATKRLKKALISEKEEGVQNHLQNLSPSKASDYSLWKATKKLKRPTAHQPPIRQGNGPWARSSDEKANLFKEHLKGVFTAYPNDQNVADFPEVLQEKYDNSNIKFSVKEVSDTVMKNINPKKAPGFDLITGKMIRELPQKGIKLFTFISNAIMRTGYFPKKWKIAQIILIQKPGKEATQVSSYRPISLLTVLSKLFEKLLLKRILSLTKQRRLIPDHQFGCRTQHSTIEQVHRVVAEIQIALDTKKYCSAAFLDVAQAFDKVWHEGLKFKIRRKMPTQISDVLCSYLDDRNFKVKYESAITDLAPISSGVPQGSVLGSFLYQLFTADLPTSQDVKMATFVDDTALLSTHVNLNTASRELQDHLNNIQKWLKSWRMKVNESKSTHVTFTLRKKTCPSVSLNDIKIPKAPNVKYLGMHLDSKLNWVKHITTKCKQLKIKKAQMYWLMGRKSKLSIKNKILLYKALLKPIWTYGIQLWGTASATNIKKIQTFQSATLRCIMNAPWYVNNHSIHRDLQIEMVKNVVKQYSLNYHQRILNHPNSLAASLTNQPRFNRLKRVTPMDLPSRR